MNWSLLNAFLKWDGDLKTCENLKNVTVKCKRQEVNAAKNCKIKW